MAGRLMIVRAALALLCLLIQAFTARTDPQSGNVYTADLNGANMVPPVNTSAWGMVTFTFRPASKARNSVANYNITLFDISGLTSVELRQAQAGQIGDRGAYLWGPDSNPKIGLDLPDGFVMYATDHKSTNGIVKLGTLGHKDFQGPMRLRNVNDLQNRIDDHDYYVLVTSAQYSTGEIRGQIQ